MSLFTGGTSAATTIASALLTTGACVALAITGCATGTDTAQFGGAAPSGGSTTVGGSGQGAGGAAPGGGGSGGTSPCAVDCTQIKTPDCQVAQCNAQSGQCEVVNDADATSCDDGVFCTVDDACLDGVCEGGPPNDCGLPPGDCDDVTCDEGSQTCSTTPKANGTSCSNSQDLCQINTTCQNGLCIGDLKDCFFSPVPDDCHISQCNPQNGQCEPVIGNEGLSCADPNDLCTIGQTCAAGVCQGGTPKDCGYLTQGCFNGVCNAQTGQCEQQAVAPGQQCNDATDQCNQGICDTQGNCNPQAANEGQSCNDNSFCTQGDICQGGVCTGQSSITQCIDGDLCCPQSCTISNDNDCNPVQIVLDAVNRGWWREDGDHSSGNDNTLTGKCCSGHTYNSYFSFDLSGVTGTVIAADLKLEIESYSSSNGSETISVWDVSTPAATLEATGTNVQIHNDLMTGNQYGSFTVLQSETGTIKTTGLNAQTVSDINAALGADFSVGCHDDTAATEPQYVRFSSSSEQRTHQLVLSVL